MDDNEAIARYVMGWEKRLDPMQGRFFYLGAESDSLLWCSAWQPDRNREQATMVAEAMRVQGWRVRYTGVPDWGDDQQSHNVAVVWFGQSKSAFQSGLFPYGRSYEAYGATREAAIHAAAVQVARMMEADLTAKRSEV